MWNAIILLIRKAFLKNQLKKEERKSSTAELKKKVSKKIKKIKFKIFGINVSLTFVVISAIISFILFAMMLFALLSFMGAISGNTILGWKDDEVQEEDPEKNWVFDNPNIYDPDTGELNISGGIYPKDPILKNRAMIRQMFIRTAKDASTDYGFTILPEYLFGIQIRESGGQKMFNVTDTNNNTDWMTSRLVYSDPVCSKSSKSCSYLRKGYSHFVGGTVSNGKDLGDPYTMKINTDKNLYTNSLSWDRELDINMYTNSKGNYVSAGHAIGFFQWEIKWLEGNIKKCKSFPLQDEFGIDESSLPFADTRPNGLFFMPDIIYSMGWVATSYGTGTSGYNQIVNSADFKKLNDRNQAFIRFVMSQKCYGGGTVTSEIPELNILMKLANDGTVQYLDEMLDDHPNAKTFWNTSTHASVRPNFDKMVRWLKDKYPALKGITYDSQGVWFGAMAACAGKLAWEGMTAEIEAAEKEQIVTGGGNTAGRWIDYVGSGKFKPLPNNKYYSNAVMATIFTQASGSGTYREESWGTCRYYWGTDKNGNKVKRYMWYGGCGVYSTAFCITNLTGTLVTVEDIQNKGLIRSLPLPNDNVISIAKAYGLESYPMKIAKSDSQFENDVIKELKDGGMIVAVWHGAHLHGENKNNFPWYGGNGHFMVIRGYNNSNNKLRVYTSVNGVGCNQEQACNIELDAGTVRKYLSFNYTTCEVIKIPGGAGSITDSNSSSSSGGITSSQSGMIWPLSHDYLNLSSLYGSRIHPITGKPGNHGGIDIPAPSGTPIYAVKDGDVILTEYHKSWGNHVEVKHYDGTITNYAHMSKIGTTKGTQVKQGDVIGYVGTTGSSTGNHLHFEYWANGKYTQSFSDDRDPCNYYKDLPLKLWVDGKLVALW